MMGLLSGIIRKNHKKQSDEFIESEKVYSDSDNNDLNQNHETVVSANSYKQVTPLIDKGYVDPLFESTGYLLIERNKGSIGLIQREYKIGFNRTARIMNQLELAGVVGPKTASIS